MRRHAKMTWRAFGTALVLGAGAAQADERQKASTATPEQAGEEAGARAATKEISGRVVQSGPSKLFVEHMGAVLEFNIASDAQFSSGDIRSGTDLKEGQEVRTSFTVESKTPNVAKRVILGEPAGAPRKAPESGSAMLPGAPSAPPGTAAPQEPGTQPAPK